MFTLFETPNWFAGFDLVLDTIALLVTILISSYGYKLFKISDDKKFAYFSLAFALMSIGFLFKLITYMVVYSSSTRHVAAVTIITVTGMSDVGISLRDLMYRTGFFIQMAATLGSLLLLYLLSQRSRDRLKKFHEVSQIGLSLYFVLLISIVSTFKYFIFYLTSIVLLALIVLHYYQNYLRKKSKSSKQVFIGFCFLLAAQPFFVFIFAANWFYFIAEVLTLVSFAMIAKVYIQVNAQQKRVSSIDKMKIEGEMD